MCGRYNITPDAEAFVEAFDIVGGLWDRSKGADGRVIESCSIVTTEPPAPLRAIHARMPVIVPPQGCQDWLAGSEAAAALWRRPYDAAQLEWYPVSTYVNNPRHNHPRCVETPTALLRQRRSLASRIIEPDY